MYCNEMSRGGPCIAIKCPEGRTCIVIKCPEGDPCIAIQCVDMGSMCCDKKSGVGPKGGGGVYCKKNVWIGGHVFQQNARIGGQFIATTFSEGAHVLQ